jgi:hypothetical protein
LFAVATMAFSSFVWIVTEFDWFVYIKRSLSLLNILDVLSDDWW